MPKWTIIIIRTGIVIISTLITAWLFLHWLDNREPIYIEKQVPVIIEKPIVIKIPVYIESDIKWQVFEVTAYTQLDEGCNNITSIGINLDKAWVDYFNIVAVDPAVIPYGSVVIIKMPDGEIIPAIAGDCGGAIKGKRLDLYARSLDEAFEFGRQHLEVAVIEG